MPTTAESTATSTPAVAVVADWLANCWIAVARSGGRRDASMMMGTPIAEASAGSRKSSSRSGGGLIARLARLYSIGYAIAAVSRA